MSGAAVRTVEQLIDVLDARKRLIAVTIWKPIAHKDKGEASAAIEIEGVTEAGLTFRGKCHPERPDEKVSLLLLTETAKKPRAFARIDWRGPQHDNAARLFCGPHYGINAGRTHFHDLRLNRHLDHATLFDTESVDLPVALRIDPEPASYRDLLQTASFLLNIDNLIDLPEPPWPTSAPLL